MGNPVHRPRRPAKLACDNRAILRADEIAGHRGVADGLGAVTGWREAV